MELKSNLRTIVAATVALAAAPSASWPCTLVCGKSDDRQAFKEAKAVFIARVVSVDVDRDERGDAHLVVEEVYKGRMPDELIVATGPAESCQQPFLMGHRYIFFSLPDASGRVEAPDPCGPQTDIELDKRFVGWVRTHRHVVISQKKR